MYYYFNRIARELQVLKIPPAKTDIGGYGFAYKIYSPFASENSFTFIIIYPLDLGRVQISFLTHI